MPKKFSLEVKSTRKIVSVINAIKTYYNEVKSELSQTPTPMGNQYLPVKTKH